MAGIFISYRREDSGSYAGRLYDALIQHFDRNEVFLDIDSLDPGEDFREVIQRTCSSCEILLAVIGRQWAIVEDNSGRPRLESEKDFVRIEITTALQKGLRVIPVLVGGAVMPDEGALPNDLRPIVYRNNCEVTDKRFHQDTQSLIDALKRMLGIASQEASHRGKNATLFPLWGIILGKTNESELEKLGERKEAKTDTGLVYGHYYVVNNIDFWVDEKSGVAHNIYITKYDIWPKLWEEIGFRPQNSYDRYLFLLQQRGYSSKVEKQPRIKKWDGHDSFSAVVTARILDPYYHKIKLDFDYGRGTKTDSIETLYSMYVSIDD
ncbi:toll/interleukin-1 receptor domain-containing protein [Alloacidobacterium sp.]|uniref:toll/interleukin-1 receptor domain-containing protein n=1 Tax=Alloacidobacterium sp. TaxID=2951999 RepID=UPI002D6B0BF7|nr:toll/interleukin-1 receptor domain-containing protein [Alloacidobacterium sp.]HYK34785.1 toll/interleukin-1 receptor domain-containing protein [Alloacidobacterium sp.]